MRQAGPRPCRIEGCPNLRWKQNSVCSGHRARIEKHGEAFPEIPLGTMTRTHVKQHRARLARQAEAERARTEDDLLLERFGPLVWEALAAFASDPHYLTVIAEKANEIEYRQALWAEQVSLVAIDRDDIST